MNDRASDAGKAGRPAARLVPLMSRAQRLEHAVTSVLWFAALVWFWAWWLRPEHNIDTLRFALTTAVLAWITLLPLYFLAVFSRARRIDPAAPVPGGRRVAMVVTKAPSEPFAVVRETLEAMLRQELPHDTPPHDTWLADEDPAPETLAWCARHGVEVSTRKGRADYHRATWPRRTRCKEGNLAFFYDHYGYDRYDFVVQLDADHVPAAGYLAAMLQPFADAGVGYVSAPSICDRNAGASWSARGRLHVEGMLHGALQAGYNTGLAPLCIGSHYAVRTAALRQIGGLGPELAEDHSTSLMMNAHGWRGVHAVDAIAHGDGPATFADLATQEFQWSRSLMTILLEHTPALLPRLPFRLKFQFLFCQLWYPLFSLCMLTMYIIPVAALTFDINMVGVTYPDFLLHFMPPTAILVAMAFRWKRHGFARPVEAKALSWEGTLFLFARWPWSLLGCLAAVRDRLARAPAEFRITPKGGGDAAPVPLRVLAPYALLSLVASGAAILSDDVSTAIGFYVFALVNGAVYALLLAVILHKHAGESGRGSRAAAAPRAAFASLVRAGLVAATVAAPTLGIELRARDGLAVLLIGADQLTAVPFGPAVLSHFKAGAGPEEGETS